MAVNTSCTQLRCLVLHFPCCRFSPHTHFLLLSTIQLKLCLYFDLHSGDHQLNLQIKGYDFSLAVTPDDVVPDKLKRTQENIKELCQAGKAIAALGPKLEEMINWLLKSEKTLTQKVNEEAKTHQESKRLGGNLRENLREALRAGELSPRYREEAGKLFNEVALLSGVNP